MKDNTLLDLQNSSYPTHCHSIIANYATPSSGISQESLVFSGKHETLGESVYTKKIQVTSWIFPGYTARKGCIIILYHAIESTVARGQWEGWVRYSSITVIVGKVR